jgi:hypothetical protein
MQGHNPEDHNKHVCPHKNLKSQINISTNISSHCHFFFQTVLQMQNVDRTMFEYLLWDLKPCYSSRGFCSSVH